MGALGVCCQRPQCSACENWSVACELNIIRASCELGVLWACSGFCWRSQGIAGELRVLRADFDFCVRASYFAVELNAASAIAALGTGMGSAADALARAWPGGAVRLSAPHTTQWAAITGKTPSHLPRSSNANGMHKRMKRGHAPPRCKQSTTPSWRCVVWDIKRHTFFVSCPPRLNRDREANSE